VVRECEELGLTPESIVAVKGPFSKELNQRLFEHYGAQLILTKESGAVGGLGAKLEAAREMGIPIAVWNRPRVNYSRVFGSPEDVLQYLKEEWGGMVR
jgi:precorrin-6A/cobalt-precorrin-6A reductase